MAAPTSPGQVCREGRTQLSRSIFQRLRTPSCECRSVTASLTAVPEQFSARICALAENLAYTASDRPLLLSRRLL